MLSKGTILNGITASDGGTTSGRVKVAYGDNELDKLNVGDILVVPAADPEFTIALDRVRAIISQVGGRTCHLANVCREKGTPLLVAVTGIMKIEDGQEVTIDFESGTVTIDE